MGISVCVGAFDEDFDRKGDGSYSEKPKISCLVVLLPLITPSKCKLLKNFLLIEFHAKKNFCIENSITSITKTQLN